MADKLTPQQDQAVHDRGGTLLVSAAAGSGKTKVLVDRLMDYLTDPKDPANLDEFLIITYTKAAASELRGKIAAKLTEKIAERPGNRHLQKQMQRLFLTKISTVHGFCSDILREYAYRLELPGDFRVADENECAEIRERVLEDLLDKAYAQQLENGDFRAFVDTQGLGRSDQQVPQLIQQVYDSARCHLNPERWMEECLRAADVSDVTDVSDTLWGRYLMEDLFDYIDAQMDVLTQCQDRADAYPEFEKVSIHIGKILSQLKALREAKRWDEIVGLRNIDYGRLVFPRKNPDADLAEQIKAIRNACKKGLEKKLDSFTDCSQQVLQDLGQTEAGVRGLMALVGQFGQDYGTAKRARRCLDFGDLEHRTLDLLLGKHRGSPTSAAGEIAGRFREIMVDEYQDSNDVQDAIFGALTGQRNNCFLVGDVKQSIYQFRLADPSIFLRKYVDFVPAEEARPGQGRKVLLSHNFRSGCEIIEAVNAIFSRCMSPKVGGLTYGPEEALQEGIPHDALPDPAVELYAIDVREETYPEEAAFVAERIHTMLESGTLIRKNGGLEPVQPEDIVILLRSPGSGASYFQRALETKGIGSTTGSGTDLLHTQEVMTLRSLLETIQNPRQDIPLISILASPVFGFTADQLAAIRSRQKKGSFFDALVLDEGEKTKGFLETLETLRTVARMHSLSVLLEQCFCLTHLDSIYAAMAGGKAKQNNLRLFYQLAVDFEKGSLRDLAAFMEHLRALDQKGVPGASASTAGCITIMSIHKSKGLEFPVVFLCNLSRKFNQESLRSQILCDKALGLGFSIADIQNRIRYPSVAKRAIAVKMAAESLSEEMRVLYVALTRPRDRLIMTYASNSLAEDLRDIALRQDFDGGNLVCRDADCFGDWILLSALGKVEAGQLHQLGDRPAETQVSQYPWKICVGEAPAVEKGVYQWEYQADVLPDAVIEDLRESLNFVYPHSLATTAPSKQTATGRKGRAKDEEAAQDTQEPKVIRRVWRRPSFLDAHQDARAYGNAMHAAMQYLRYEVCGDIEGIRQEVQRMAQQGLLRQEAAGLIDCEKIAVFFRSDLGKKLRMGVNCIREFKFSILDDGEHYVPGLTGEQVLLQGVVDCAILEEDGITILDFKSDRIRADQLPQAVERYRPQVEAYANALSRIYGKPIKQAYLYFFQLQQFAAL